MEIELAYDSDEQVELYYADRRYKQLTQTGDAPRWATVPAPHTRCSNTSAALETIEQLKKFNPEYQDKLFRVVRIRDKVETFNEWSSY